MQEDPAKAGGGNTLPDQLRNAPDGERVGLLGEKLAEALAKILGTSAARIVRDVSVAKMGLDSLMLNQLRNWIQLKLGVNYPLMKIAKGPTLGELAAQLLTEICESHAAAPGTDPSGIGGEGDVEVVGRWFIRNRHNRGPVRTRIFCFHPVGAGASMFSHFLYNAPEGAEVLAVQLPGRENRSGEPFYEEVPRLVADLAKAIQPMLDLPFIVFGHSFGGIIGFELVRYLRRHYGVTPAHLFVSGTIAPQLTRTWKERDVISQTAVFANSEEKLLSLMSYIDDVAFLKRILPVMKRDMPLIMNYPYRPEAPFDFPVTGFAASRDEVVLPGEVSGWREQTTAEFNLETVDGDHWFLSRNQDFILGCVAEALAGIPV
jgi:polyketide synthase 12